MIRNTHDERYCGNPFAIGQHRLPQTQSRAQTTTRPCNTLPMLLLLSLMMVIVMMINTGRQPSFRSQLQYANSSVCALHQNLDNAMVCVCSSHLFW